MTEGTGDLISKDMEKAMVLNAAFTSVFTSNNFLQESQATESSGEVWSSEDQKPLKTTDEDSVR